MKEMRKFTILIGLLLVVALILVACSQDEATEEPAAEATVAATEAVAAPEEPADEPTPAEEVMADEPFEMKLTLNYLAGGPQAGFTYAKELGYYDDVGLDVTIEEGQGSGTTSQLVATEGTDIGYADGAAAMAVRSKGGEVKIVAPILQTNGFAIISLAETGIETPADLVGKTIAIQAGSAHTALLDAILEANGISQDDVELVNIDPAALVGALLEGEVDAILGGADFQSVQIRDRGFDINEIMYRDAGVPTVGLSVIANDNFIAEHPDELARFIEASLMGWDAARNNPEAAAQSLVDTFISGDLEQITKQLLVDLNLVCAPGAETLGAPPAENWDLTWDLLTTYQDLPTDLPISEYFTTDFIPADAPLCPPVEEAMAEEEVMAEMEPYELTLTLNYLAGGPQAGFTYAKELGYYDDLNLDVTIEEGQGSGTTSQLVATEGTDIGYADGAAAMAVRAKGGEIKIVAPILQTNGFAVISLAETGIVEPADLVGKTIAIQAGSAHTALLDAILEANGISQEDLELVNIDPAALVGALLEGSVDAILGGADFQSVQIRDRGFDINEIMYRDAGVPTVGLSVIANDNFIAEHPDVLERFIKASLMGWDAARNNPEAAAQSLVDTFVSGDLEQITKQLLVDLALVCAPGAKTLGAPPAENWDLTWDLLTTYQELPTDLPISEYFTMDFIPADAPPCP